MYSRTWFVSSAVDVSILTALLENDENFLPSKIGIDPSGGKSFRDFYQGAKGQETTGTMFKNCSKLLIVPRLEQTGDCRLPATTFAEHQYLLG
jgi:hypothetical protein